MYLINTNGNFSVGTIRTWFVVSKKKKYQASYSTKLPLGMG
uniref:Uncharacterized protein n=1 Tax=Meloidogyne enterolobii TaxID=390850 RepID=A0A6V7UHT9_MELEN|nr:unnamed protein product [Meloidogyne enterolobii]